MRLNQKSLIVSLCLFAGPARSMEGFLHRPSTTLDEELKSTEKMKASKEAFKAKKTEKALKLVDEAIASQPKAGNAHFLKAVYLEALRKNAEAQKSYDRAIELSPENTFYRQQRGHFFMRQKNFALCEKDFNESLRMKNYYPWVGLFFRGICQLEQKNEGAALKSFEAMAQLDPLETSGEVEIIKNLATKNDFKAMLQRNSEALRKMPGSASLWNLRLAALLKNDPTHPEAPYALAVLRGPLSEGRKAYDIADMLKPVFPDGFKQPSPKILDEATAFEACRKFHPAYCYMQGQSLMAKKSAASIGFYQEACEKGLAFACSDLGYATRALKKDAATALKWVARACDLKDPIGCFNAACYECVSNNNVAAAWTYLDKARGLNLDLRQRILSDKDLSCLKSSKDFDERYQKLIAPKDFSALAN